MNSKKKGIIKEELIKILKQAEDRMTEEDFYKHYDRIVGGSVLNRFLQLVEIVDEIKEDPENETIKTTDIDTFLTGYMNGPKFKIPRFFRSAVKINGIARNLVPYEESFGLYVEKIKEKKFKAKKFIDLTEDEYRDKTYTEVYCEYKDLPIPEKVEVMAPEPPKEETKPEPVVEIKPEVEPKILTGEEALKSHATEGMGSNPADRLFDYSNYEKWLETKARADEQYKILIKQLNGEDAVIIIGEDYGSK